MKNFKKSSQKRKVILEPFLNIFHTYYFPIFTKKNATPI